MYGVTLLMLLALAAIATVRALHRGSWLAMGIGLGIATATLLVLGPFSAWGAMLWFDSIGFVERIGTVVGATVLVSVVAAMSAALLVALGTLPSRRAARRARNVGIGIAALAGAAWGLASWGVVDRWVAGRSTGTRAPIFGRDVGFPLFTLPALDALFSLLLLVALIGVIVAARSTRGRHPADAHRQLVEPLGPAPQHSRAPAQGGGLS